MSSTQSGVVAFQRPATIEVTCAALHTRGLTQVYTLRSSRSDQLIARIEHDWVWLDTTTGRSVPLDATIQAQFAALAVEG